MKRKEIDKLLGTYALLQACFSSQTLSILFLSVDQTGKFCGLTTDLKKGICVQKV